MEQALLEFLVYSNGIEDVWTYGAAIDAHNSWKYALKWSRSGRIDQRFVKGVHYHLMRVIDPEIAGKIRKCRIRVGDEECMKPDKINDALNAWCSNYPKVKTDWEEIKRRHVEFLKIHPFEDGNGRTARILMNLERVRNGLDILVIHTGEEQKEYYKWFN